MLKKTAIIVSVAAAGVLGLGGLAFANTSPHTDPARANVERTAGSDCTFGQEVPAVAHDLTGGDGAAGVPGLVTGAVAPITAQPRGADCSKVSTDTVTNANPGTHPDSHTESVTRGSDSVR